LQLNSSYTDGEAEAVSFDPQLQSVSSTPRPSLLLLKTPLAKAPCIMQQGQLSSGSVLRSHVSINLIICTKSELKNCR